MSAPSRGPPAVDLLWAYQLKKEHAYLKTELESVTDRCLKAERAAEAAHAAAREIGGLRADLESYMNDPEEVEKNRIVSNHLSDHNKQIAALNKRFEGLGSAVRSTEDDFDRLDGKSNAHEMRLSRFEERMMKIESHYMSSADKTVCEELSGRVKTLETQVSKLIERTTQNNDLHALMLSFRTEYDAEISRLEKSLFGIRENAQTTQINDMAAQRPPVTQSQALLGPSLSYSFAHNTFSKSSLYDASRDLVARDRLTQQQAQIPRFPEPILTESQATTQLDDPNDAIETVAETQQPGRVRPNEYDQSSPRKKQKVSQDTQGERLRQMLRENEIAPQTRALLPQIENNLTGNLQQTKTSSTSYEATQRIEPPKSTVRNTGKKGKKTCGRIVKKTGEQGSAKNIAKTSTKTPAKTPAKTIAETPARAQLKAPTKVPAKAPAAPVTKPTQNKLKSDQTNPTPAVRNGRSSRSRRSSSLQVLEHRGRGLRGCYARPQPKIEEEADVANNTAAAAVADKPPIIKAMKTNEGPVDDSRSALVKLAIPGKMLQFLE